jgi:hypothetical protein
MGHSESEADKGNDHQIVLVEATEDAAEALESSERTLDFVAARPSVKCRATQSSA